MISKNKMDYYYHHQEEPAYWKQSCNFQMKGCKYSEKLTKKPDVSPCKGSMEGFEYSSLFSSKTYSVLSYIVGGFVGSKSQMNNNKHNLSYDLSAAIFNLLNSCKLEKEKSLVRKSNENNFYGATSRIHPECYEKYIVNKSSQKGEKTKDCIIGVMELDWFSALPLQEFVDQENYMLNFNEQCDMSPTTKNLKENPSSNCDKNKGFNKIINNMSCDSTENLEGDMGVPDKGDKIELNGHALLDNPQTDVLENFEEIHFQSKLEYINKNSSDVSKGKINLFLNDHIEKPEGEVKVTDSSCQINTKELPTHSINYMVTQRFRQQSECSIDSTDSESFIVFDDHLDQEEEMKGGRDCFSVSNDDYDSDDDEEDEDSSYDEYDVNSVDIDLAEANSKWMKNYREVIPEKDDAQKKVRFNDDIKINKIVAWDYAYRAARAGPWEQMARDRVRFRERILRLSPTISTVLRKEHRDKIYKKLYS